MSWVNEGVLNRNQPWQNWKPKFFALRGADVCIFEKPPVSYTTTKGKSPFFFFGDQSGLRSDALALVILLYSTNGGSHGRSFEVVFINFLSFSSWNFPIGRPFHRLSRRPRSLEETRQRPPKKVWRPRRPEQWRRPRPRNRNRLRVKSRAIKCTRPCSG